MSKFIECMGCTAPAWAHVVLGLALILAGIFIIVLGILFVKQYG